MKVEHNQILKRFIGIDSNNQEVGFMEYTIDKEDNMHIIKTKVYTEFEGKGYANHLFEAVVVYVREHHKKMIPVCSYVVKKIENNPKKYEDIIVRKEGNL